MDRFTKKAESILNNALTVAREFGHTYVGSEHLLLSMTEEESCTAAGLLANRGISRERLRVAILDATGSGSPYPVSAGDMTPRLRAIIEHASAEALRNGAAFIGSEHLLFGITEESGCAAYKLLTAAGIPPAELRNDLGALAPQKSKEKVDEQSKGSLAATPTLAGYGHDLTAAARRGRLDPVIGRERETERLIGILSRRQKNNPCLVGEPGVGKTAVVEGLALLLAEGNVPSSLRGKTVVSLDLGAMIAGAKYRGEFEDRLKNAMAEAMAHPEIILFIDEIHTIVGAGAAEGAVDAANIMKPALSRGQIQVIGATTASEYRQHIEKDAALARRFQALTIEEPTEEEALVILQGLRSRYEAHHHLHLSDDALHAAVSLSRRYLPDRFLPDKALDLLDETAARLHMRAETQPPAIAALSREIAVAEEKKEACIQEQDFEGAAVARDEVLRLQQMLDKQRIAWQEESNRAPCVGAEDIAATLTAHTGIPVEAICEEESSKLARLEEALQQRVIGQEEAIRRLCAAIRRSRLGLRDPHRPVGSFLFLGPTGVGKTALSVALSELLFGERQALLRMDMSEYMEKHSAARLIGAPPGYVGYEEGGLLTEAVRRRPYSVLLFDEIEKAHPDVLNLLLQILEDGRLTDSHGKRADFSNAVIIMTTNVGGKETHHLGFGGQEAASARERLHENLRSFFRPEFLNRIDDIIPFHPLDERACAAIVRLLLDESCHRAAAAGITLVYEEDAVSLLVAHGYDKTYGARPLRRTVTAEVEDPLSDRLLSGRIKRGDTVLLQAQDGRLLFTAAKTQENAPVLQD